MEGEEAVPEVDEAFIEAGIELFRVGQQRSLLWTITNWLERASSNTPCLLVDTATLFPRQGQIGPQSAKFAPEVYACVDQLLFALTETSAELHRAAQSKKEGDPEGNRIIAVAEILKCISTHVYAARMTALNGFDVQVNQILRTYTEYLELLALVCADQSALDEFIASNHSEGANDFWHRHLSRNKARKKRYLNSVLKADLPEVERKRSEDWYARRSRLMSECVHPTINAVLRSGRITLDPCILPYDTEDVLGSLIYLFCAFADTLEVSTLDYVRAKSDTKDDPCKRYYMIIMLAVMLGYRRDFVYFGQSEIDEEGERAVQEERRRRSKENEKTESE